MRLVTYLNLMVTLHQERVAVDLNKGCWGKSRLLAEGKLYLGPSSSADMVFIGNQLSPIAADKCVIARITYLYGFMIPHNICQILLVRIPY